MLKNSLILLTLVLIVALPFVFRAPPPQGDWREGDPKIVVVSPHNEGIRFEFASGFSKWHKEKYGKPVKIVWRNIGGTTEISRYLGSEYTAATKAWWQQHGKTWPPRASDDLTKTAPPTDPASKEVYDTFRQTDAPEQISCKIDLFFGGGEFDHTNAFRSGYAVPIKDLIPANLLKKDGVELIPESLSGETWRNQSMVGTAVSTFGMIYNVDRIKDLNITNPPAQWSDMADYKYFKQLALADPTKSGSIAKAYEMLVHQQMHDALIAAGYNNQQIAANEKTIKAYAATKGKEYTRGDVPEELKDYQKILENGFITGLHLLQKIGANARYFTDSGSKVSIDVSMGDAAVGMSIDFYARYQAQATRAPDGTERAIFVSPIGGTSVSVDPISLLRGAGGSAVDHTEQEITRQTAIRFIEFCLSEEGQRIWTYKVGDPEKNYNEKYALRRLPIRRDFYPSTNPSINQSAIEHAKHAADDLMNPIIDPYQLAQGFTYYPRWTGEHFSVLRDIVRAMCMDSGEELKDAWQRTEGNASFPEMPTVHLKNKTGEADVPLTWKTAPDIRKQYETIEYMRNWTEAFRNQYRGIGK